MKAMENPVMRMRNPIPNWLGITAAMLIIGMPLAAALSAKHGRPATKPEEVAVYFSPRGGCESAIVTELGLAKSEVLVQAYAFNDSPIIEALKAAHRRGVSVRMCLDKKENHGHPGAKACHDAGIPVFFDAKHKIAHSKVIVIDGQEVVTGSFNFTKEAESDHLENLLIIQDKELAGKYRDNWLQHREHCEAWSD